MRSSLGFLNCGCKFSHVGASFPTCTCLRQDEILSPQRIVGASFPMWVQVFQLALAFDKMKSCRHKRHRWRFSRVGAESLRVRPRGGFVDASRTARLRGCVCRSQVALGATPGRCPGRHGPARARPSQWVGHGRATPVAVRAVRRRHWLQGCHWPRARNVRGYQSRVSIFPISSPLCATPGSCCSSRRSRLCGPP